MIKSQPQKPSSMLLFSLVCLLGIIFGILAFRPAGADGQKSAKPAVSEVPGVSSRFVTTELIDLYAAVYSLPAFIPDFKTRAGAVAAIEDWLLIAEQDGRFVQFHFNGPGGPQASWLAPRLELNQNDMVKHFEVKRPGHQTWPVRVTGLLYLPDMASILVAHGYWNTEQKCIQPRVSLIALDELLHGGEDDSGLWRTVYESSRCKKSASGHETGGKMVRLPNSNVLLSVGHAGFTSPGPKDLNSDLGKMIEINPVNGRVGIYSKGHRNPQGLAIDSKGLIWATEHGPEGGDELNLIKYGHDYGWPFASYGLPYGERDWPYPTTAGSQEGFEEPVFAWLPSIGVSNLIELGKFHPRWDGDFIVTSLREGSLHRLRRADERIVYEERIRIRERIRDAILVDDGSVVLWTDDADIIKIKPIAGNSSFSSRLGLLPANVVETIKQCAGCHEFDQDTESGEKISLFGVYRRKMASGPRHLYSDALIDYGSKKGSWQSFRLDKFLEDPQAMVPGTTMAGIQISDRQTRLDVVEFLKTLR